MMRMTKGTVGMLMVAAAAFIAGRAGLTPDPALMAQDASHGGTHAPHQQAADQDHAGQEGHEANALHDAMAQMAAMMQPGEHHAHLNALVGEWDTHVEMWMAPGTPPMTSDGIVRRKWVLDGHFVQEDVEAGTPMGPFAGRGYTGFNNFDQVYESVWMENMNTGIMWATGAFDPETRLMTFVGTHRDPQTGALVHARGVLDMTNDDEHTYDGYAMGVDGKEWRNFRGVFKRKNSHLIHD